jgi:DNA-binding transcriptional regulator YiaG
MGIPFLDSGNPYAALLPTNRVRHMDELNLVQVAQARAFIRSGGARAVRLSKGLSMREMASALGVQASTLLRWEQQLRVPRPAAAVAYKALLDELMAS